MIYKLLHKLFGWDYIQFDGWTSGIRRVYVNLEGKAYYWKHWSLDDIGEIRDANSVFWLTCKPEKYLKPKYKFEEDKLRNWLVGISMHKMGAESYIEQIEDDIRIILKEKFNDKAIEIKNEK